MAGAAALARIEHQQRPKVHTSQDAIRIQGERRGAARAHPKMAVFWGLTWDADLDYIDIVILSTKKWILRRILL